MIDDAEFLAEFEACRWPLEKWHHRDHIKLAYLYLMRYSFDDACARIRAGIKAHNATHKIPEGPTSGYHETMTQAWLRLGMVAIRADRATPRARAGSGQHPRQCP